MKLQHMTYRNGVAEIDCEVDIGEEEPKMISVRRAARNAVYCEYCGSPANYADSHCENCGAANKYYIAPAPTQGLFTQSKAPNDYTRTATVWYSYTNTTT